MIVKRKEKKNKKRTHVSRNACKEVSNPPSWASSMLPTPPAGTQLQEASAALYPVGASQFLKGFLQHLGPNGDQILTSENPQLRRPEAQD